MLDGQGRVHGAAGVCETSFQGWDDAVRVRDREALHAEAQMASWPLAASSFWLPAGAPPRCALESLAASIFELHAGAATGGRYDASTSGAEWWANVSDSAAVGRSYAEGGYGKVALHFDKDEEFLRQGWSLCPSAARHSHLPLRRGRANAGRAGLHHLDRRPI